MFKPCSEITGSASAFNVSRMSSGSMLRSTASAQLRIYSSHISSGTASLRGRSLRSRHVCCSGTVSAAAAPLLQHNSLPRPIFSGSSAAFSSNRQRRTACRGWMNQEPDVQEQIQEATQPRQGDSVLESLRLKREIRESVSSAVEDLGGKVTVGDVSARAGVTPYEAEEALQALAADAQGTLQVSNEGDVLYVLPRGFRGAISARSWRLRAEPALQKAANAANYVARVAFGAALVTSVAVVWLAIIAILSSANSDRDDRRGGGYRSGPNIWFSPTDMFFFTDPYYMRRRRGNYNYGGGRFSTMPEAEQKMSFVEAIFSFVFGDGDPNADFEEQRWQTLGRLIAARGGVVTAEEMAPYLDLPSGGAQPDDEGYVVPALLKFSGHPEVDDSGNLLYVFPDLQRSGGASQARGVVDRMLTKEQWKQTEAEAGQKAGTIALGAANLVGVAWLSSLLADSAIKASLAASSLGFVAGAMPLLQVYAASFFAIPLVRWLQNQRRNAGIEEENSSRREAAARLGAPRPALAAKLESRLRADSKLSRQPCLGEVNKAPRASGSQLADPSSMALQSPPVMAQLPPRHLSPPWPQAARRQGKKRVITDQDITYRSDRDLADQRASGSLDWEAQDFDERLQRASRDKTSG